MRCCAVALLKRVREYHIPKRAEHSEYVQDGNLEGQTNAVFELRASDRASPDSVNLSSMIQQFIGINQASGSSSHAKSRAQSPHYPRACVWCHVAWELLRACLREL